MKGAMPVPDMDVWESIASIRVMPEVCTTTDRKLSWVGLALRPKPGVWEYVRINVDEMVV